MLTMPDMQSRRARLDADPHQLSGDARPHPGNEGETIHKTVEPERCIRVGGALSLRAALLTPDRSFSPHS
jgi:hypothetical protein